MDPTASNSFIPKKNLEGNYARQGRAGTGLVLLLSILIFIASLVAAGGVFAYTGILKQLIVNKSASLELNKKAYDPAVIEELISTDRRINEAQKLLAAHIAPSAIFAFLSQQTLEKVQLTSFDYSKEEEKIKISLKGLADSFSSVALQSDQFAASKVLKDIVFSDVNVENVSGKVGFSVVATIVPTLTEYSSVLTASPASVLPETPVETSSTTESE
jgi:hypothetical protein